jgi:hypothetical protein
VLREYAIRCASCAATTGCLDTGRRRSYPNFGRIVAKNAQKELGMRNLKSFVLAGALVAVASPVFAAAMVDTPMGAMDMDPLNILAPASSPAAAAPAMKHHMMKHHMMKHHMMKHHMSKKKM